MVIHVILTDCRVGPGQLTRALLALPKERIKKLIVLETHDDYLQYLRVCYSHGFETRSLQT